MGRARLSIIVIVNLLLIGCVTNTETYLFTQAPSNVSTRIDEVKYAQFLEYSSPNGIVPGLKQGLIQQGLAYYPDKKWMLLTSYQLAGKPAVLSVLNGKNGEQIKSLEMYEEEGIPYSEHAASIAVSKKHVWIGSEGYLYQMSLEDLKDLKDGEAIIFKNKIKVPTNGSISAYDKGVLWVGDYGRKGSHETPPDHRYTARDGKEYMALIYGYQLTDEDQLDLISGNTLPAPDYLISAPEEIQGLAIYRDHAYLSMSHGLVNASRLSGYSFSLDQPPHEWSTNTDGSQTPLWFLDSLNETGTLLMPPMSEGVFALHNDVYVIFESAAQPYRVAPMDYVYRMSWSKWLEQFGKSTE